LVSAADVPADFKTPPGEVVTVDAQPVGFVAMPNPFNIGLYLKAFAAIVLVGFGAYRIGLWQGEGYGYAKRDRQIAAEREQINEQIVGLNAALDEALAKLEAGREQASADVTKTLRDITPAIRAKCSKECSLPQSTREALEAIQ
jgi:hypothetical protein